MPSALRAFPCTAVQLMLTTMQVTQLPCLQTGFADWAAHVGLQAGDTVHVRKAGASRFVFTRLPPESSQRGGAAIMADDSDLAGIGAASSSLSGSSSGDERDSNGGSGKGYRGGDGSQPPRDEAHTARPMESEANQEQQCQQHLLHPPVPSPQYQQPQQQEQQPQLLRQQQQQQHHQPSPPPPHQQKARRKQRSEPYLQRGTMSFDALEAVIASGEWRRPISATAAVERRLSVPGEAKRVQAAQLAAWPDVSFT